MENCLHVCFNKDIGMHLSCRRSLRVLARETCLTPMMDEITHKWFRTEHLRIQYIVVDIVDNRSALFVGFYPTFRSELHR